MNAKDKKRQHAKSQSPTFAINRYAQSNAAPLKLPAPTKPKGTKPKLSEKQLRAIDKKKDGQLAKFEALAETTRKVGSTFGIQKAAIMEAVESGNIDHALSVFRRRAYMTIVALIPVAEAEYKKSRRDHQAYVLNALITQGRELAADLAADGDRGQLATKLIEEILDPAFKAIISKLMSENQMLKTMLVDKLKPGFQNQVSASMDTSLREVAAHMSELYKMTSEQITRQLLGD